MKRVLAAVFAMLLLMGSVACAEGVDVAAMSNEDLHAIIDSARGELAKRELVAGGKTVLFEQDGVTVYLTGNYTIAEWGEGKHVMLLEAAVLNGSAEDVGVYIDNCCVNGWEVYGGSIVGIGAGKNKKATLEIRLHEADIHSYEDIEDIEFKFHVSNASYKKLFDVEGITVHFNAE